MYYKFKKSDACCQIEMWVFYLHQLSPFLSDTATLTNLGFDVKEITFLRRIFGFLIFYSFIHKHNGGRGEGVILNILEWLVTHCIAFLHADYWTQIMESHTYTNQVTYLNEIFLFCNVQDV